MPTGNAAGVRLVSPDFFTGSPAGCAEGLVGCHFRWGACEGRIVETEAYSCEGDEACHTAFRPSARAFVDAHEAGDAYVTLNYGMHWMFNILVKGTGGWGFVLLRAMEPVRGLGWMRRRRGDVVDERLMAGPGCLTRALGVDGRAHGCSFLAGPRSGLRAGSTVRVVAGPRIGIVKATELPWRFGDVASPSLSRKFPQGSSVGSRSGIAG
jgi:DNA-3-methyladenine glycosylase